MEPRKSVKAILDMLASQLRQGETSLIFKIEPDQMEDAMNALRDHRKLFAPVIRGATDTAPVYAAYERMRQADMTHPTILLLVECQSKEELSEAIRRMPMRKSSEWRSFDETFDWDSLL